MRHRRKTVKLGRKSQHRDAMLANMAGSLIEHSRIKTSLAKAKAVRPLAEKLVTLGKTNSLHSRRVALARLKGDQKAVKKLFSEIAPRFKERPGGYTRILKIGPRYSDAAKMALIEWVDAPEPAPGETPAAPEQAAGEQPQPQPKAKAKAPKKKAESPKDAEEK